MSHSINLQFGFGKKKKKKLPERHPFVSLQNKSFPSVFYQVLSFHLKDGVSILDPTPGEGFSWKVHAEHRMQNKNSFFSFKEFRITEHRKDLTSLLYLSRMFDGIFFDPPYIFGLDKHNDIRAKSYGDYNHSLDEVAGLFQQANKLFPALLNKSGKLFVKYTDVFSLKDRKFYFCAGKRPIILSNFNVIDHYIIQHHHVSPTAWQVKNRPCGISNYTYLTVFEKIIE